MTTQTPVLESSGTRQKQPWPTLGELLLSVTTRCGPRPALAYRHGPSTEVWTYDRLWADSGRVASWLREQGVEKGDRIVLWSASDPWWVVSFFACARLGAILVPLDVHAGPDFIDRVVKQTEPKLALVSRHNQRSWTHPIDSHVIEDFASLPAADEMPDPCVAPDDTAEIMFTSGTTSDPRGVVLTHQNITSNAISVDPVMPKVKDLRLVSILPLSHMFEQTVGLVMALNRGASIFYPASRQRTVLFQALKEHRATAMLVVPQALQLLVDAVEGEVRKQGKQRQWALFRQVARYLPPRVRPLLFRSVHQSLGGCMEFFVSGGAGLDDSVIDWWERLGIAVAEGYGATETSPVITATPPYAHRLGSVGQPVPNVELKVEPDGEILVHGPNVAQGYWNDPTSTDEVFQDGWYRTGDLGRLDAEGYVHLSGRKKNMIVLANGQNVFPEDVERALSHVTGLKDSVVLAKPGRKGPEVHAVLLLDSAADAAVVVRQANAHLDAHQKIRSWAVWADRDFPRTHTQKLIRRQVEAQITSGNGAPVPTPHASDGAAELGTGVAQAVADAAGIAVARVLPESSLDELGLDSLGRVELLAAIETDMGGVYLDDALVTGSTTVAELELLVDSDVHVSRPTFPTWPTKWPARVVRATLQWPIFRVIDKIAPTRAVGLENLANLSQPVLLVANHTSHLDSPTVLKSLPTEVRSHIAVAAASDYFFSRRGLALVVQVFLNAFPFSRTGAVRPTLEHCGRLIDQGWSILLFPEGTRSTTGEIGTFKQGVGLLAVELRAPVVPIRIAGLEHVLPKGRSVPHRGPVTVTIGSPLTFPAHTSFETAAGEIESAVRSLGQDQ